MSTPDRRFPIALTLAAIALLALIATARAAAGTLGARAESDAPADALDLPYTLAVSPASEVYIGLMTDTAQDVIARFTNEGRLLGRWSIANPSFTNPAIGGLAVGGDGMVYATLKDTGQVQGFTPDLTPSTINVWEAAGLKPPVATGLLGRAMGGAVYTLVAPGTQAPDVVRYNPRGSEISRWQVEHSAYDLAVGSSAAGPDGLVYVVDGGAIAVGGGHVVRYTPDGQRVDAWDLPGAIRGIGTSADGRVHVAVAPYRSPTTTGTIYLYDPEGTALGRCELPGGPVDLAVDPQSGDIYVIVEARARTRGVLRLNADCSLLDTWDPILLSGLVTRTPAPPGTPSSTATPTATGGATPTSTVAITSTVASTAPASTPTGPPPSATREPTDLPTATPTPGEVYLPWVDGAPGSGIHQSPRRVSGR